MLGAVSPRPYFSNATLVAVFTIFEARAKPYSSFQRPQTATVPERRSPIPPHLLFPPSVLTIKDLLLVNMRSYLPLIIMEKEGISCFSGISVISSYFLYFSRKEIGSILIVEDKKLIYRVLGVRTALKRFNSGNRSGC